MERRCIIFISATAFFVPLILLSDGPGLPRQLSLFAATAVFLWFFSRRSPVHSAQILCAIAVATAGEIILSRGWGLYGYHFAAIPLYVPVGHGVFYTLAAETAGQEKLQRYRRMIITLVLVLGSVIAATTLIIFNDQLGLLWWVIAAALIMLSRNSLLLSVCFVYTMLLEWLGTALGNWRWLPQVPGTGLHAANPPSGVGILYVLLDLITVAIVAAASAPGTVMPEAAVSLPPVSAE
jgi:hypothetical protein